MVRPVPAHAPDPRGAGGNRLIRDMREVLLLFGKFCWLW
jgi:hypothetical protein